MITVINQSRVHLRVTQRKLSGFPKWRSPSVCNGKHCHYHTQIQKCKNTKKQKYKNTNTQKYKNTKIQKYKSTITPGFGDSSQVIPIKIQKYENKKIQKNTQK